MQNDYELSETEMEAYRIIENAGQKGIAIISLPHKLQGAIGKLKSHSLIEIFREDYTYTYEDKWTGKERTRRRRTNWVRGVPIETKA